MTVEKTILNNGVRLLSINLPDSLSTTILIFVKAGSRYESKEENGIAHFIEHTIFKGSTKYPTSQKVSYEIELLGGQSNAFTAEEYTGYYIKCINENFEPAFDILSDIFLNPLFDKNELEKEKGVVIEELRMYEDKPETKVQENFQNEMFGADHLGQSIGGPVSNISKFTREMMVNFRDRLYTAENIVVVVAGKLNKELVKEKAKIFESIEKQKALQFVESKGMMLNKTSFEKKELNQTSLIVGTYGLKKEDPDIAKLMVASTVLGGGMGSDLFLKIRDELGLAYYIYSTISAFEDRGLAYVHAGVDSNRIHEAIEAIKGSIENLKQNIISEESLQRAKALIKSDLTIEFESSDDIAEYLGKRETILGSYKLPEKLIEDIEKVTIEDIQYIMNKIWSGEPHISIVSDKEVSL